MPQFGGAPKCVVCAKSAYPQESENYDGKVYHKACFKCKECNRTMAIVNIAQFQGMLYCKPCFQKLFKARGKYDDIPGAEDGKELTPEEAARKKFEDSNVAKIGTKEDKAVRKAAAEGEDAWKGAGSKPGLEIWRIEKFKVVPWPKQQYGSFYSGDSYIVMKTYVKPDTEALAFDLHFWLGAETSQDEMGTAAYKTVELDDYLDQVPVQYREVQGHESDLFLELFPNGIKLLKGGVESGFNKVKPEAYKPRLMHCKGKNNHVRVEEVPLEVASLNQGDAFILDAGLNLYQFNGPQCGIPEKNKARDVRLGLNDERNGRCKSTILEGVEDNKEFWELLGAKATPAKGDIAPATDDAKVEVYEKIVLKVSDDSGAVEVTEVARGAAVNRGVFGSSDAYILDTGSHVYAFVGINASKQEKAQAVIRATEYLAKNNRPNWIPITRVLEGGAMTAFEKALQ